MKHNIYAKYIMKKVSIGDVCLCTCSWLLFEHSWLLAPIIRLLIDSGAPAATLPSWLVLHWRTCDQSRWWHWQERQCESTTTIMVSVINETALCSVLQLRARVLTSLPARLRSHFLISSSSFFALAQKKLLLYERQMQGNVSYFYCFIDLNVYIYSYIEADSL